jgi:glycosyltransferase involved in cell wall biosynthesis
LKKIAIYHNLTSGGSKRELFEFTRRFNKSGFTIHLYGHHEEKSTYLDLTNWVSEINIIRFNFIKKISFTLPFLKSIINLFIDMINFQKIDNVSNLMAKDIDGKNYDFVFVHHNKEYVQSPFILKYIKSKTVYFCNEPFRQFYETGIFKNNIKENKTKGFMRLYSTLTDLVDKPCINFINNKIKDYDYENILHSDLVLANSYFSRENILAAYGIHAKVVHLGGDTFNAQTKISSSERKNAVLSVGAINALKGYEFIIQSLGTINEDERPMFIIVGNASNKIYLSKIQTLADKLNVSLSIHENISDDDLSLLINKSTLFVYAPLLEPLGLSPLEAMSFGLPVVAVKEGGPRETIVHGKNGYLVNRDPIQFGEKIISIIKDHLLREKLSIGAKESIQSYWNWDMAFERLNSSIASGI